MKNTVTNYLTVFVRVLQGILVTRQTVWYLGPDYYGFWALMWSLFAYALLFDFGFSMSAQKYTSSEIYKTNIEKYNKIISAVFSFHFAMLIFIVLGTLIATYFLPDIIRVYNDPEKIAYCRKALLIFGISTAFIFPLGMFSEILVGQQKLYVRNYVNSIFKIIELIGIFIIFILGGRLIALVTFTMITSFLNNLVIAILAVNSIKGFKLTYKLDWQTCKEISGFSGFIYIMSLSRLVLNKSSRLLISIFCGLESVGAYHLASRLGEFALLGATQYQENVRPISANLHSKGEFEKLSKVIMNSMGWNMFISVIIMLPAFIFAENIIYILFNIKTPQITYMSELFIVSTFTLATCRSIPQFYLQMADSHKLTGYVNMTEAICNIVLNISLLPIYGVAVVLWNSIILRLIFTFVFMVPKMLRNLKINPFYYMYKVYILPAMLMIPAALVAIIIKNYMPNDIFWSMCFGSAACILIFGVLAYYILLDDTSKQLLKEKLTALFKRLKSII